MDWGNCVIQEAATISCLEPLFANVIRAVIALAGVGLFLMLIVAGFNFLFAAGDQKKLELAKGTMTNAIVGMVVITSAYLILRLIGQFTGIENLTNFRINIPQQN